MLILTRKENESIFIGPPKDIDPSMTVSELFADGGIEILVSKVNGKQVKIGVEAPNVLNIVRSELCDDT